MTPDVTIYYNGWISPRTIKALAVCACGVKCDDMESAFDWCRSNKLVTVRDIRAIEEQPQVARSD